MWSHLPELREESSLLTTEGLPRCPRATHWLGGLGLLTACSLHYWAGQGPLIHSSVCKVCRTQEARGRGDIRDWEVGLARRHRSCVFIPSCTQHVFLEAFAVGTKHKFPLESTGAAFWGQPGLEGIRSQQGVKGAGRAIPVP